MAQEVAVAEARHLPQADRHIAECKAYLARQEQLIRQMTQRGQSTEWTEDMLIALKMSLRAFEKHRKLVISAIDAERRRSRPG
jgi:hypothetical protein